MNPYAKLRIRLPKLITPDINMESVRNSITLLRTDINHDVGSDHVDDCCRQVLVCRLTHQCCLQGFLKVHCRY